MLHGLADLSLVFMFLFIVSLLTDRYYCYLCEGRTVYHGPREWVVPFFEGLGFQIPERKGVADFIQEICSEKDQEVGLAYIAYKP